ncbi:4-hydroxy-2-oxoheptanedioate aldolase [Paraburkholderia caballeronis]|uniref:2,4-dihydroxyhept-2-enedioate aldolase n=1 Tax=Paraburkholderia caballeronis TaxID=416943 RepID=A0A1H7VNM6_9BURK|nr:4-hydroxy-2-oxoheptanedioate aldolase [Paraburkholderia caballeronis]PXW14950.1 2,4-dihydroxyhept-2-enedioate aldolase [Paraburkholderia caballeronis]PXW93583.1 2,4-dihydroxyhept-2-enedioate aldolase [Paraburkholderia caballeronis]RAJ88914.1 2,4-dihydroxyhept-2-enedioate aldolase [Paraburkholderia caballeronis]SED96569.1 2,4-dihydroxyhept-2-enedioate aldolase [Paraburkholderia caballeronis]SEM10873.1 2,4-dihydroxyhept-2-enedioate aldolase [Paraburkholderia caballeronis]
MPAPANPFKRALAQSRPQIGLWAALADPYVTELLATAGFDWLLIDGEHAPNDVRSMLAQLQAVAPYPSHPVARPVRNDSALIKQLLDIGAQSLLIPMVDDADDARAAVAATRYPPHGIRGVGSAIARASRWNTLADYPRTAADELCVLVQAETTTALANLAAIASVDGVDGVFFGPADLSASMGLIGQTGAEPVRRAIVEGIHAVRECGKAAGVLTADPALADDYLQAGATFVAVGTDVGLLSRSANALARRFKPDAR